MRRGTTSESHSDGRKLSGMRSKPPAPALGIVTFFFLDAEAGELLASPSSPSLVTDDEVVAAAADTDAAAAAAAAAADDDAAAEQEAAA